MFSWFDHIVQFFCDHMQNRYRYRYVGEKLAANGEFIILYNIAGKRCLFEISAQILYQDNAMLKEFHPLEVKRICTLVCQQSI